MNIDIWFNLLATSFFISLSPGAGAITTMNQSLCHGFKKSLYTIAGLQVGWAIQIFIVSIGIGTLITSNEVMFSVLKWSGIIYLIMLGLQQVKHKANHDGLHYALHPAHLHRKSHFFKAVFISLTNIKATLFLILFIHIFINPDAYRLDQIFIVLATMLFADKLVMLGYAGLSLYLKKTIKNDKIHYLNQFSGLMLILIGTSIAYQTHKF